MESEFQNHSDAGTEAIPESAQTADLTGTVIEGDIELVRPLGSGGFSSVWLGKQRTMDRQVAVKILARAGAARFNQDDIARFAREVRLASTLSHHSAEHEKIPSILAASQGASK